MKKQTDDKGWSVAELARRTGVPYPTVHAWWSGARGIKRPISRDDARALATACSVPLAEVLDVAGLSDPDRAADLRDADAWLALARGLSDADRVTVEAMVRSFRDSRGYLT